MEEKEKSKDFTLADDIEYIIIQRENPNDIEDLTGEIIATLTREDFKVADGYMVRTKFKEKD